MKRLLTVTSHHVCEMRKEIEEDFFVVVVGKKIGRKFNRIISSTKNKFLAEKEREQTTRIYFVVVVCARCLYNNHISFIYFLFHFFFSRVTLKCLGIRGAKI